jgi:hypothetical protein
MEQSEINTTFLEVQDLRSNIFLSSVLYPAFLLWCIEIYNLVFEKSAWAHNTSDSYLVAFCVIFGILFALLLPHVKYITEVKDNEINIRLLPFKFYFKKISIYMIKECKIQAYDPFTGKYMEVSETTKRGNLVLMLKLISGEKMRINSRKPKELYNVITQAADF